MSNPSEKTCLAAVLTALNAAGDDGANAHSVATLKALTALPEAYTEVHLARKLGDAPRRAGAASDITQWRLLTRAVARTYGDAQELRRRAAEALEEKTITIAGEAVVVTRAGSDDAIGDDDRWWSGLSEWSFAI